MKLTAICFIILSLGCVSSESISAETTVTIGNLTYSVEIADSFEEWQNGLMFRDALPESKGMLFIFPDERERSFWMKNMKFRLDIAFISANLTVVDIVTLQPCGNECVPYASPEKSAYVLEVNSGSGIREGDSVTIGI